MASSTACAGDIDRHVGGKPREQRPQPVQPLRRDQQAESGRCSAGADQLLQHHLAFGHEQPRPADQVALADVAIGVDARIVGVVDFDDHRHGRLPGHGRMGYSIWASVWPSLSTLLRRPPMLLRPPEH